MLGPRLGRYADGINPLPLGNPVNACMGLFVLWWGWLAFNSGEYIIAYRQSELRSLIFISIKGALMV